MCACRQREMTNTSIYKPPSQTHWCCLCDDIAWIAIPEVSFDSVTSVQTPSHCGRTCVNSQNNSSTRISAPRPFPGNVLKAQIDPTGNKLLGAQCRGGNEGFNVVCFLAHLYFVPKKIKNCQKWACCKFWGSKKFRRLNSGAVQVANF